MSHNPIRPWRNIDRRKSRQIMVGKVPVGGDAPISVQTMTNTDTSDVRATLDQVLRAADVGHQAREIAQHAVRVDQAGLFLPRRAESHQFHASFLIAAWSKNVRGGPAFTAGRRSPVSPTLRWRS